MIDNMVVPVNANSPATVIPAAGITGGAGQDSSQTANFTNILQTVISNLNSGLSNVQGGIVVNADGKTISLDDLIQQILNGGSDNNTDSGKKTDSGNNIDAALQQMITQLQASIAQPTVIVPSGQTNSSGVNLTASSDNLTNNTANPSLNAIDAAMMSVAAALAGMQQNPANNAASQTSDNMNSSVSGSEGAALIVSALNAAMQNPVSPAQDTANAVMPNAGSLIQNVANFAMPNAGSLTQNAANAATLNTGTDSTQNAVNTTLNAGSAAQNTVNAAMPNAGSLMQNALNVAMLNAGSLMQNAANAATLNAGTNTTQNGANAATLNSGTDTTQNTQSPAVNALVPGDLSIKELRVTIINESKSGSEDAGANAGLSTVPLHQTPYTEDTKPAQETLPVSRLNELSEPILKTLGSGDSNLVIKLSPPDMGTIQIRLRMENGVLTADFKVDSSAVKDLFASAMPQIKQSIESSGIKTGNFFTDLKEDSFTDGRRQQGTDQQQQRHNKGQKSQFFDYFA